MRIPRHIPIPHDYKERLKLNRKLLRQYIQSFDVRDIKFPMELLLKKERVTNTDRTVLARKRKAAKLKKCDLMAFFNMSSQSARNWEDPKGARNCPNPIQFYVACEICDAIKEAKEHEGITTNGKRRKRFKTTKAKTSKERSKVKRQGSRKTT